MRFLLAVVVSTATIASLPIACRGMQAGAIRGAVYDSVGLRRLARASVQLVGVARPSIGRTATTDSAGAFTFDGIPAGRYVLGFLHDALDSLGLDSPRLHIEVRGTEVQHLQIGIPGPASLVASLCGTNIAHDSTGLLVGRLRHAAGVVAAGGTVSVSWVELRFTRQGLQRATASQRGNVGEDGLFAICGVPMGTSLVVRGWSGRDSTGLLEFSVPASGLLRRDLVVGRADTRLTARTNDRVVMREGMTPTMRRDTTSLVRTSRGAGRVRGTVRLLNGGALRDVQVNIWGTGLETTTDADGGYALDSVPEGSQTLVARSIGLVPWHGVIDVTASTPTVENVTLAPFIASLDTLRVRVGAGPRDAWRTGFETRRGRGFGDFLDETQIERANPLQVSDLFRDLPGIDVISSGTFGRRVMMRGRAAGMFCVPAVFVDGLRFFTGGARPGISTEFMEYTGTADLEFVVNPRDVKAVEVYPHDSSVPAEFDDPHDGCGSIVIWTGARRR